MESGRMSCGASLALTILGVAIVGCGYYLYDSYKNPKYILVLDKKE